MTISKLIEAERDSNRLERHLQLSAEQGDTPSMTAWGALLINGSPYTRRDVEARIQREKTQHAGSESGKGGTILKERQI